MHASGLLTLALTSALLALPGGTVGQIATGAVDTTTVQADPGDVVSVARAAQALFERRRSRHLPLRMESFGGRCDEIVGRLCTTYDEGEWYPIPEAGTIVRLRSELLVTLDSLQVLAPSSEWILGQRVWYRHEGGDLEGALQAAKACGSVDPGLCLALEGFALHVLERFEQSQATFERAFRLMDPDERRRWLTPSWAVDADLRELIEDVGEDTVEVHALLESMWSLADPLYLAEGNDRRTEHYSRWTVSRLRNRARNPFLLSWGSDLEELTVRHGWETGWERTPARDHTTIDGVVGHKHPEGRDYMPSGEAVASPAHASEEGLRADRRRPRSLYAPAYAPVLLPMDAQIAVFPRGRSMVVVSSHFLPDDTTYHAAHSHPLPWMDPSGRQDRPDRIGLFALSVKDGSLRRSTRSRRSAGALMLDVPAGDYVVSAESWSPGRLRAGRLRRGVPERPAPEDIATLSDLILLEHADDSPESLEEALDLLLARPRIGRADKIAIGWEVAGLGFRPETLRFEVSVRRDDRSVLHRVGAFLRLSSRPQPISLSWEEVGPAEPGQVFRYLSLDLPTLDPGRYQVRLVLKTSARSDAVTTALFEVSAAR